MTRRFTGRFTSRRGPALAARGGAGSPGQAGHAHPAGDAGTDGPQHLAGNMAPGAATGPATHTGPAGDAGGRHGAVRWSLALYPRAWRRRYGAEMARLSEDLIAAGDSTPWRAGLDLLAGAATERGRALARSRRQMAVSALALVVAGAGIGWATAGRAAARPAPQSLALASARCMVVPLMIIGRPGSSRRITILRPVPGAALRPAAKASPARTPYWWVPGMPGRTVAPGTQVHPLAAPATQVHPPAAPATQVHPPASGARIHAACAPGGRCRAARIAVVPWAGGLPPPHAVPPAGAGRARVQVPAPGRCVRLPAACRIVITGPAGTGPAGTGRAGPVLIPVPARPGSGPAPQGKMSPVVPLPGRLSPHVARCVAPPGPA